MPDDRLQILRKAILSSDILISHHEEYTKLLIAYRKGLIQKY